MVRNKVIGAYMRVGQGFKVKVQWNGTEFARCVEARKGEANHLVQVTSILDLLYRFSESACKAGNVPAGSMNILRAELHDPLDPPPR
jgi:hypothetical protein